MGGTYQSFGSIVKRAFENKHERSLEIVKMRNTQIPDEPMKFKIQPNKGIEFFSD